MSVPIEHLPYYSSPPIEFVFKQTIEVDLTGHYVWPIDRTRFTPDLNLADNALYYINSLTFAGDIGEADYQGAISIGPTFSLYLESEGANPQLRNPIDLPMYFDNFRYVKMLLPRHAEGNELELAENRFLGTFEGDLIQTPPLIGKQQITLTMILSVQEITDDAFVQNFKERFADSPRGM